ncbi:single-stranded DNA-binding protein [Amylibacter sp.]|nr:single-stranded DNA-binding protein [Amylibacter sp.]
MAGSLNKVTLIGNLGADPEIRTISDNVEVCSINLATARSWKDKKTNEQVTATEWHSISIWEKSAINYAKQYLKKGSQVYVEGKLETNKWQDQNGNDRYTTQVVLRPYIGKLIGLTRVDQEIKNESDIPGEKVAFKDVDDIDLGDIPF